MNRGVAFPTECNQIFRDIRATFVVVNDMVDDEGFLPTARATAMPVSFENLFSQQFPGDSSKFWSFCPAFPPRIVFPGDGDGEGAVSSPDNLLSLLGRPVAHVSPVMRSAEVLGVNREGAAVNGAYSSINSLSSGVLRRSRLNRARVPMPPLALVVLLAEVIAVRLASTAVHLARVNLRFSPDERIAMSLIPGVVLAAIPLALRRQATIAYKAFIHAGILLMNDVYAEFGEVTVP